jgi:hypothetical protein
VAHVTVVASHPDGRRIERAVPSAVSDAVLRTLLAEGWRVEELRR